MKKFSFNDDWNFVNLMSKAAKTVNVPHDAMIEEERSESAKSGINGSYFLGGNYSYEKSFSGADLIGKTAVLEFEGVYKDAEVYLNSELVAEHNYGYTGFYVDLTGKLNEGENVIKVIAKNSDQPNSRWYSGAGIYRPVNMWVGEDKFIAVDGVKIKTKSIDPAVVDFAVKTNTSGELSLTFKDADGNEVFAETLATDGDVTITKTIEDAKLWTVDTPYLYALTVKFGEDEVEVPFGIRTVSVDSKNGLLINGKRELLKGACIHHDNGLLGAIAHPFAEERKIRLLKEAGYNAIRSAHNPCSKALLDACDRLGMYVMDEYVDMWYIHKTKYDYALHFEKNFKADLKDMVEKDYNHPCVVLYSTGNEVGETAQKKGIAYTKEMTDHLHSLDDRPVSCGVNIFFNFLSSMGFGVYSDKKADAEEKNAGKKRKAVGSEFFNNLSGLLGDDFMKFGATLHGSDVKTRDAFANMDVAGYNYGVNRYKKDVKKYPDRVILGSETFCCDTGYFYNFALKNPAVIGDFDWAGMDYLGEVGIGSWVPKQYTPTFSWGCGWMTAGSGRIDITGKLLGEANYKQVVFGKADMAVAVRPIGYEKHSPSAWKMTDAMTSWSWKGEEGKKAVIEVYAKADLIELYVNDKLVAKKKADKEYRTIFNGVKYQNGTLKAVAYKDGAVIAEKCLTTAGDETVLTAIPENTAIGTEDLAYIRFKFTDKEGALKPQARAIINVSVENGKLLGLGHACSYNPDGYLNDFTDTYYGEALAIVKPLGTGEIKLTATSELGNAEVVVEVK